MERQSSFVNTTAFHSVADVLVFSFVTIYRMNHDIEHVQSGGDAPGMITEISTFAGLPEDFLSLASI
jgi:hypothetical protein